MEIDRSQLDGRRPSPGPWLVGAALVVMAAAALWPKAEEDEATPPPPQEVRLQGPTLAEGPCPTLYTAKPGRWATFIGLCSDVDPGARGSIPGVTRLLVWLPSAGSRAAEGYQGIAASLAAAGQKEATALVVPQIPLEADVKAFGMGEDMAFWSDRWWAGPRSSHAGARSRRVHHSSFLFIDGILNGILAHDRLPDLEEIVVAGEGEGADAALRLAAASKLSPPGGVRLRYVAVDPGSYLYLDGQRPAPDGEGSYVPDGFVLSMCPRYDDWPFGLRQLHAYAQEVGPEALAAHLTAREVAVAVHDGPVGVDEPCAQRIQGPTPRGRAAAWLGHLAAISGEEISRSHKAFDLGAPPTAAPAGAGAGPSTPSDACAAALLVDGAAEACKPL